MSNLSGFVQLFRIWQIYVEVKSNAFEYVCFFSLEHRELKTAPLPAMDPARMGSSAAAPAAPHPLHVALVPLVELVVRRIGEEKGQRA